MSTTSTVLGPKNCGTGAYNKKQKVGVLEPDVRLSSTNKRGSVGNLGYKSRVKMLPKVNQNDQF